MKWQADSGLIGMTLAGHTYAGKWRHCVASMLQEGQGKGHQSQLRLLPDLSMQHARQCNRVTVLQNGHVRQAVRRLETTSSASQIC